MKILRSLSILMLVLAIIFTPMAPFIQPVQAAGTNCVTSVPTTGTTVTICLTTPTDGSTVSADVPVTATATLSTGAPRVQRIVFYLDGAYLLTDYQSPYNFTLPTRKWVDGAHTLAVEALMSTNFVTQRASVALNFNNGITTPPVNTNQFQASTGTTPAPGAPFTVVAGGDGASGELNASKVSDLIATLNPNLFIYLGDVYEKGSKAEFSNWYGSPTTNFGRFRSITNPTVGNHEYSDSTAAAGYFDYWNNIPNYYSYNAGGWHFISLNSNSSRIPVVPGSAQYIWLQQDLAANAGACTIAYYHHPLYNIGPEGATTAMSDIWKLLAQNGVDIVLNGHDHDYQRWVPLDGNGVPAANGMTEFVVGSSGHGLQTFTSTDSRVAYSNDTNPTAFGALVLQLNPSGAHYIYENMTGSVLDSGIIPCNTSVQDTQAPSVPTGLSATAASATRVNLTWAASTDNIGVAGYTVYRNGAMLASVPGSGLTFSDTSALPVHTYSYAIDAFDLAGNHSAISSPTQATTPAMPASLTFTALADTYVNAGSPTTIFGSATTLRADSSPDLHSYLRFNVTGLGGTPIVKASLKVFSNSSASMGIQAVAVTNNSWSELSTNYNNAPALGSLVASSGAITTGTWATIDVTPYITGEGSFNLGLTTTSTSALSFASREAGANAPQLVLDFTGSAADTQPPSVPSGLSATASSATNVNLTWAASSDNTGVTGYTVYRNGAVLTTVAGTSLAYSDATVQPASTYQYAVDAFDLAGNHSAASAAVQVTTPAASSSLTFLPVADTYVNAASPTTIFGTVTTLRTDASPDVHSYLRFSVTGLAGKTVTRARLLIFANSSGNPGIKSLAVANNTWSEAATNYNNAPALGSLLATSPAVVTGTWITLDVTAYITGEGSFNFGIASDNATAISLASREAGANAPQLILDLQ